MSHRPGWSVPFGLSWSHPLSQDEFVLGFGHFLPAELEGGMAHNLPAVLHAQPVDDGDVGPAAGRLALGQRGNQIAGAVQNLTAIGEDTELQA